MRCARAGTRSSKPRPPTYSPQRVLAAALAPPRSRSASTCPPSTDHTEWDCAMTLATELDAITAEVLAAALSGIVQGQQQSLFRTGFSTVIRETQDASCALLHARGRVVAQHVVLGLHMGAFPACIEGLFQESPPAALRPGD